MRIGILGGTFDPIHRTHLDIARAALETADLDLVIFVVAARPPHKHAGTHATAEQRYAMVEAALADEPQMAASAIELHRHGLSYTAETLEHLALEYPNAALFLILGMDALKDLPKWKDPEHILAQARLLVFPRAGETPTPPRELEGCYELLPFRESAVSSTQIRQRARRGEPLEGLVPSGAINVIQREGIYGVVRA
jgi:nicotinate-nucleotide adenylyltransferase